MPHQPPPPSGISKAPATFSVSVSSATCKEPRILGRSDTADLETLHSNQEEGVPHHLAMFILSSSSSAARKYVYIRHAVCCAWESKARKAFPRPKTTAGAQQRSNRGPCSSLTTNRWSVGPLKSALVRTVPPGRLFACLFCQPSYLDVTCETQLDSDARRKRALAFSFSAHTWAPHARQVHQELYCTWALQEPDSESELSYRQCPTRHRTYS